MLDLSQYDIKGLNLLYELHENLCENLLKELRDGKNIENVYIQKKEEKLGTLLYELQQIANEINERKKEDLIYSVEDIYKFAGQFDKYTIFRFYRTSKAFKKYGDEVYGNILYQKSERESLEASITNDNYKRNDGKIYLRGASQNEKINSLLKTEGFLASEAFEVLTSNLFDNGKQYKKEGNKEIPNTIKIKFDPSEFDLEKSQIRLAYMKLNDGYKFLHHELVELYANLFVINPEAVSKENEQMFLLNEDKSGLTEEAEIRILSAQYRRNIIDQKKAIRLNSLLRNRRIKRFEIIKKDLGISNKQLEQFKETYPDKYKELCFVTLTFQTETLTNYKTDHPVYWDFERFIHIYLRHYKNFFIEQSTARGTLFQYTYKDVRRLACLIIENLKEEIETELKKGNGYFKYDDMGYYFNGNYYTIRIDNGGRLMQFHPLE
ncbi:MAG: hypothetical protein KAT14_04095 [Candidatus Marinimicrobia bacterium]|nr:hypothetical protein [Candidatus Neomarinimicrobiota bacterium]